MNPPNNLKPLGKGRYQVTVRVFLDNIFIGERDIEFSIEYRKSCYKKDWGKSHGYINQPELKAYLEENFAIGAMCQSMEIRRDGAYMDIPCRIDMQSPESETIDVGMATPEQIEAEQDKKPLPESLKRIFMMMNVINTNIS